MLSDKAIKDIVQDNYEKGSYFGIINENYILANYLRARLFIEAQEVNCNGSALEIGVYGGDTALLWMELMFQNNIINPLLTVDIHRGGNYADYYLRCMELLTKKAKEINEKFPFIWRHYPVFDTTFMNGIYPDLIEENMKRYFFINLDGPHDDPSVIKEIKFFYDKLIPGGVMIIDDLGIDSPSALCTRHLAVDGDIIATVFNGFYLKKRI